MCYLCKLVDSLFTNELMYRYIIKIIVSNVMSFLFICLLIFFFLFLFFLFFLFIFFFFCIFYYVVMTSL